MALVERERGVGGVPQVVVDEGGGVLLALLAPVRAVVVVTAWEGVVHLGRLD